LAQEVEHYQAMEWIVPDPGKEEREIQKKPEFLKEGQHRIINHSCMIMQPIGRPSTKVIGQWKGCICDLKDYNAYTDMVTVVIETTGAMVHLSGHCLFPR